ncbi:hypothetical protein [Bradyrhizobium sp.]|uniref:hypothetical protein n=1 Tax=Bradyrhizobium sp. TaxID=376 RepID=UPI0025BC4576|nr:hypothetical protein [Bradyrhizobium sp.]
MRTKQRKPMSVTFIRTGERRYAVRATTADGQAVQMDPAPGYDPLMPHDLQHFIVERCLGIEGGIFGRLAAGGTAGTFHATATGGDAREASRRRRKRAARDGRLMPSLADDYARSERATYVCWHDWLAHSDRPESRARAVGMREGAAGMLARMPPRERAEYSERKRAEIRREFQRLSERWTTLAVGESFTEPW